MTKLRKSFILLSAAITMGNLQQAQAASKKTTPPAQDKSGTVRADQAGKQDRVSKKPRASKRMTDPDFNLGMPAGSAYDVVCRGALA